MAKIILLDIETAPSLGWVWGKWKQNVIDFEKSWYILSFAFAELHSDAVDVYSLRDFPRYKKDPEDDKQLVKALWKILDDADIVIAHNGDAFDIKKSNARFAFHGLKPPSPYKTVDTLKLARRHFRFESNSLHDLAKHLQIGGKTPHHGFSMWRGCMAGDDQAWDEMEKYNAMDIVLLERIYLALRPWSVSHPNVGLLDTGVSDKVPDSLCPTCGSENTQRRGYTYSKTQVRQRWQCKDCGSWHAGQLVKKL